MPIAKFYNMTANARKNYFSGCSQDRLVFYAQTIFASVDSEKRDKLRSLHSGEDSLHDYLLKVVDHVFPEKPVKRNRKKVLRISEKDICLDVRRKVEKHAPRSDGWLG